MIISLINHTNGKLTDEEVQNTIRAINRQIEEDYEPYWSLGATLRLEGKAGAKPKQQEPSDMRGDAVQAESYEIDGVGVSNFVLPLYFTGSEEVGGRNDFLGRPHDGKTLKSFGVNPGGYIGFFNPQTGDHETFSRKGDAEAERRMKIKLQAKTARRAIRYRRFAVKQPALKKVAGK